MNLILILLCDKTNFIQYKRNPRKLKKVIKEIFKMFLQFSIIILSLSTVFTQTVPSVSTCDSSQNKCQNGGYCVILFGTNITCTCAVGFTGKNFF